MEGYNVSTSKKNKVIFKYWGRRWGIRGRSGKCLVFRINKPSDQLFVGSKKNKWMILGMESWHFSQWKVRNQITRWHTWLVLEQVEQTSWAVMDRTQGKGAVEELEMNLYLINTMGSFLGVLSTRMELSKANHRNFTC